MKRRCLDPQIDAYRNYGLRGVKVGDRWIYGENGKHPFSCFLEDVGLRPSPEHTLDRIDNLRGNYEPGAVRWAIWLVQQNNRRDCKPVTVNGQRFPSMSEAARSNGVAYMAAYKRLKRGWSPERAFAA
jgi:hypothetical protein